jgi:hypothetical protein
MEPACDETYVVYVRDPGPDGELGTEQVVARCPTHEEALRVRHENQQPGRQCVIRFDGVTGGGD